MIVAVSVNLCVVPLDLLSELIEGASPSEMLLSFSEDSWLSIQILPSEGTVCVF